MGVYAPLRGVMGQLLYVEMEWGDADRRGDAGWFGRNLAEDFYGVGGRTGKLNTKAEDVADIKNRKDKLDFAYDSRRARRFLSWSGSSPR